MDSGLPLGSDWRRISGVSRTSSSPLRSAIRLSRLEAHVMRMVSGAVGSRGHLPEWMLLGSSPRKANKSGETRKKESYIAARRASVGVRGLVGGGREATGASSRRTRSCHVQSTRTAQQEKGRRKNGHSNSLVVSGFPWPTSFSKPGGYQTITCLRLTSVSLL